MTKGQGLPCLVSLAEEVGKASIAARDLSARDAVPKTLQYPKILFHMYKHWIKEKCMPSGTSIQVYIFSVANKWSIKGQYYSKCRYLLFSNFNVPLKTGSAHKVRRAEHRSCRQINCAGSSKHRRPKMPEDRMGRRSMSRRSTYG